VNGVPNLDQHGMTYCHSYATAALASALMNRDVVQGKDPLHSKTSEVVVSGLMTGAAMQLDPAYRTCEKPEICDAIEFLKKKKACTADQSLFYKTGESNPRWIDDPAQSITGDCVPWERKVTVLSELQQNIGDTMIALESSSWNPKKDAQLFFEKNFAYDEYPLSDQTKDKIIEFALNFSKFVDQGKNYEAYAVKTATLAPACFQFKSSEETPVFKGNMPLISGTGKNPSCRHLSIWNSGFDKKTGVKNSCFREAVRSDLKDQNYLLKNINDVFDQPNTLPVGVAYCWTFLLDGADTPNMWEKTVGGCFRKGKSLDQDKEDGGKEVDHKSVLIGRRVNPTNGRCEFLLRNSWGNECTPYPGTTDNPDEFGNYYGSCQHELSTNGHADPWVDADTLLNNIISVDVLE